MSLRILFLAVFGSLGLTSETLVQEPRGSQHIVEIDFCQPAVTKIVRDGHASFQLIFSFDVDERGRPVNISRQPSVPDVVDEVAASACIKTWQFDTLTNRSSMLAVFDWEHGFGWRSLQVFGKGITYKVSASGVRCPYCNLPD
jgi:hypothetical protein